MDARTVATINGARLVPLVHLNGTSRDALINELAEASSAVARALLALHTAAPNARDFYLYGPDAYRRAVAEHQARIDKLVDVRDELAAIADAVDAQS